MIQSLHFLLHAHDEGNEEEEDEDEEEVTYISFFDDKQTLSTSNTNIHHTLFSYLTHPPFVNPPFINPNPINHPVTTHPFFQPPPFLPTPTHSLNQEEEAQEAYPEMHRALALSHPVELPLTNPPFINPIFINPFPLNHPVTTHPFSQPGGRGSRSIS